MYDETTRQQEHYWESLAYAQKEGHAEGLKLDIEKGCVAGRGEGIEQAHAVRRTEGKKLGIEQGRRVRVKYVDFPNKRWLYFSRSCCWKFNIRIVDLRDYSHTVKKTW